MRADEKPDRLSFIHAVSVVGSKLTLAVLFPRYSMRFSSNELDQVASAETLAVSREKGATTRYVLAGLSHPFEFTSPVTFVSWKKVRGTSLCKPVLRNRASSAYCNWLALTEGIGAKSFPFKAAATCNHVCIPAALPLIYS